LPRSQTDEIATPEERLAARMVARFGLAPPIDVERIAATLATVTDKKIPGGVDGLCRHLKVPDKRPQIWISQDLGPIRRRFTLAHEIGHIIIPWHMGTIVDDLDAPQTAEQGRYREMEAEANRFAAELLMPTAWIKKTIARTTHASRLMSTIVQVAQVSYAAAQIRVLNLAPAGFVGAETVDDLVVWAGRTNGTRAKPPIVGKRIADFDTQIFHDPEMLVHGPSRYMWWKVRQEIAAPASPSSPWRTLLEDMLLSLPSEHREITRSRVNAVVGVAIGRLPKGAPVDLIYQSALEACQNRNDRDRWLPVVFGHPLFSDYLLARCHERANAE
jgi:Zn-dependent peptidase ImmA (M78 family)